MQHQLLGSGAERAHLYVYDGTAGILLEQKLEPEVWDTIRQEWSKFMALVRTNQPPALTERDTIIRSDEEWVAAAREFVQLKQLADDTAAALDAAKQQLIALTRHNSEQGGGVAVSRYWKSGAIDYKRVP